MAGYGGDATQTAGMTVRDRRRPLLRDAPPCEAASWRLCPEPVEIRERELPLEICDVVANVEDETPVVAAVLDAAQPSPDHLEIEVGAVYRPSDHDSPGLRRVEALPEDSIVH